MPLYEYQCPAPDCRKQVEKLLKMQDLDKPVKCPKCEREMKRKVSRTSFSLKGGGWAESGYS